MGAYILIELKHAFVTGAAGFIGSHLVEYLLHHRIRVTGWDNFNSGQEEFLKNAFDSPLFKLIKGDNLDLPSLIKAMNECDFVFHLAANADIRFGALNPKKDVEQNLIATSNVLEAMRINEIKRIAFTSTGSIYGESDIIPIPENAPFPIQTSFYGASKLGAEGLIQAYCESFGFEGYIFRLVSVFGERYSHGHVFDFYKQLTEHPEFLNVLGDGNQKKSYIYVLDCINAMWAVISLNLAKTSKHNVAIFNVGLPEVVSVKDSIKWICEYLNLSPKIIYSGGTHGWIGDNPHILLDIKKLASTGWKPMLGIKEALLKTLVWLIENKWIYEKRRT